MPDRNILLQEKYYAKLWSGHGAPSNISPVVLYDPVASKSDGTPLPITPQLGWFYVDADTGDFYIFNGTNWTDTNEKWTGGFL